MTLVDAELRSMSGHACPQCAARPWGQPWELGSAAFWVSLAQGRPAADHRLASSLEGELVACMLGGWGVPGDVGVAAFDAVRTSRVLLTAETTEQQLADDLMQVLQRPLNVTGRERAVRYRFWRQRPVRIAAAVTTLRDWMSDEHWLREARDARWLREQLRVLPGVGPKTASWVVRNHLDSDDVAIIDIHIARAGVAAGVFCHGWRLPRDYGRFEAAFTQWAAAGRVRSSTLDATIWRALADLGAVGETVLGGSRSVLTPTAR